MRDQLDRFDDATVVALTFGDIAQAAAHRAHLGVPFPVLADPGREVYRRFDLRRGTRRQVWNPGTLRMYTRLLRRGRRWQHAEAQDVRQLGGDFVIGPDGRLAAGFWPSSPDQRPSVDELVAAVAASRR